MRRKNYTLPIGYQTLHLLLRALASLRDYLLPLPQAGPLMQQQKGENEIMPLCGIA